MLPKDPFIMLSFINTKLRDEYSSLDELCRALDADKDEILGRLKDLSYIYDPERNQFT